MQAEGSGRPKRALVARHGLVTRITHWINVLAISLLLMSGMEIFNAHPALYWGQRSTFDRPWLAMSAEAHGDKVTAARILGVSVRTLQRRAQ